MPSRFRVSIRGCGRPKASLCCCESWRWRGCAWASWLRRPAKNSAFAARRIPPGTNSFRFRVLHCVATAAVQPARPRRPDHNKDAMGANLVPPKGEIHHGQHRHLHRRQRRLHRHAPHPDAQRQRSSWFPTTRGQREGAPTSACRRPVTTSARRGRRPARPGGPYISVTLTILRSRPRSMPA